MANRKVYIVGRKNHTKPCDISVPEDQDAVSRQHLEITDTGGRDFLVVDISGQNGTEIWENGDWVPINQGNVRRDTPLRLGQQYQTSVGDLLDLIAPPLHSPEDPPAAPPEPEPPAQPSPAPRQGGGAYLDPETGEIIRR
tara:strand:+ start:10549 stop:10968 length:420 start_codon:yes stop_codon:yes gene_type:complete